MPLMLPLPHPILVTDAKRLADPLPAMARLPRGAAVILRHYEWSPSDRLALLRRMIPPARRRRIQLLLAHPLPGRDPWRPDGVHLPEHVGRHGCLARILLWRRARPDRLLSMACHGARALGRAEQLGLDLVLLSPILPTASHPGAVTLGPLRAALLARRSDRPVAALGGLSGRTARRLPPGAFIATAGIFTEISPSRPR